MNENLGQVEDAELVECESDEITELEGQGLVGEDDLSEVEKRYNERVAELVKQGFTPRKARRYLDSLSRKSVKKFLNKRKKPRK